MFSFDPSSKVEAVVYSFRGGSDGGFPVGSVVEQNGVLVGTTQWGGGKCGEDNCGTVFSVTLSGQEKVIHRFVGVDGRYPMAGLTLANNKLYGTTAAGGRYGAGVVFEISNKENIVYSFGAGADGRSPEAPLLALNGTLYGTTTNGGGGQLGNGTVFGLTP